MFNTILIALDMTDFSERVMEALYQLPIDADTQVILSHVISPSESGFDSPADRPSAHPQGTYRAIEEHLHRFQSQLPAAAKIEIVTGDPAEEIIRLANIYAADLIILGTRGLTGMRRVVQGSVSGAVVADAPCSVFVVKPV
ncbi:universal stress protein [Candidatus Synechococcus calcipolaris G9]|uniref:Universal stress protein n=1 Tax=Candidatus Synechococcus calcipolaris G9 TaxID=1497997 RepID=A0ABT6EWV2_9SYNE|nr:universal stress protein [Candidatus Synechococcus calcipolaris]MDG2990267.1 universal stress protein [Candidatus Synechococcus calcipolaris G9]